MHYTLILTSCQLEALSGERVFHKCEVFQRVGAFKSRRAYQAIGQLRSWQPSRMFATVSSEKHGQGFALACRLQGVTVHVVMAKPFSAMKHRAVLRYGTQMHEFENLSCTNARLRELLDGYQPVVVQPYTICW